jgi:hypothetical protein
MAGMNGTLGSCAGSSAQGSAGTPKPATVARAPAVPGSHRTAHRLIYTPASLPGADTLNERRNAIMRHAAILTISLLAGLYAVSAAVLAGGEHSMTGCLAAGATEGSFRLTDLGLADGPAAVEIASASVDLAPHVGHKVEITGSTVDGTDPAAHTMSVSAMKHLAATCP